MHLSTNISHWVCVFMGLFLIVTGMVSRVRRPVTTLALHGEPGEAGSGAGKRAVLIGIGLFAVAYGVSRVLN